jgi:hypothetical protein
MRVEIAGKIAALHKEIGHAPKNLAKADGVIRLFDPFYKNRLYSASTSGAAVKPIKQGELGRFVLNALRKAGEPARSTQSSPTSRTPLDG